MILDREERILYSLIIRKRMTVELKAIDSLSMIQRRADLLMLVSLTLPGERLNKHGGLIAQLLNLRIPEYLKSGVKVEQCASYACADVVEQLAIRSGLTQERLAESKAEKMHKDNQNAPQSILKRLPTRLKR